MEEHAKKSSFPKPESITDSTTLQAYINILEDGKNGFLSKEKEILLEEKVNITRSDTTDRMDVDINESAQRARAKMKEIRDILSPRSDQESRISLRTRMERCREELKTLAAPPNITFSSDTRNKACTFSNDMKTAKTNNYSDLLMSDFDLTKCTAPVTWRVKLEGEQANGQMCVGVAHKSWVSQGFAPHKTWVIRIDGNFFYDGDKMLAHGLNMKDAAIEITYDPRNGKISFACNQKQFDYVIPEANRKELFPAFFVGARSSMTIV
jgi:hypothetical protein